MAKTKQTPHHNPTDLAKAKTKSGNQSSNHCKQKSKPQPTDTENVGNTGRGRRGPTKWSKNVFFHHTCIEV